MRLFYEEIDIKEEGTKELIFIAILTFLSGIGVTVLAIKNWINFLGMDGGVAYWPGLIGLIRLVFGINVNWTRQITFWLAIFESAFALSYLMLPFVAFSNDEKNVFTGRTFYDEHDNDGVNVLARLINPIFSLLKMASLIGIYLSIIGVFVLNITFIRFYMGDELLTSFLTMKTVIIQNIIVDIPVGYLLLRGLFKLLGLFLDYLSGF